MHKSLHDIYFVVNFCPCIDIPILFFRLFIVILMFLHNSNVVSNYCLIITAIGTLLLKTFYVEFSHLHLLVNNRSIIMT